MCSRTEKIVCTLFMVVLLSVSTDTQRADAQILFDDGADPLGGSLQVTLSPTKPRPHEAVFVSVSSFSVDINRSTISWYRDGVLEQSGLGQTTFSFIAGDAGSADTIRVVAQPLVGSPVEETVTVRPADVMLLWQAEGYTPPFYRGKTLHASEGDVVFLAIPDIIESGVRTPASSLIFTWEEDGVVLGSQSGVGRDTLTIQGDVLLQPVAVAVEVETLSGETEARRSVQIPVTQPVVRLYEHNPVLGILFESALTALQLTNEETTLEAVPYFFSLRDRVVVPSYEWEVGGSVVETTSGSNITLRQGESRGQAQVSVSVQNPFSLFESASQDATLTF